MAAILATPMCLLAQEHAPTVEQCRADAAVWVKADVKTPTMKELWARCREMNQCTDVDPAENSREHFLSYVKVCNDAGNEYTNRVVGFLNRRYPTWKQQFDDEDAAGKR